jgi:Domain of unknown function (DUF397)
MPEQVNAREPWRTSSFSDSGTCVEIAKVDDHIAVRHSRNTDGTVLIFTVEEWRAFVAGVREGEFDY